MHQKCIKEFHEKLKTADITPVVKKDGKHDKSNYKPVKYNTNTLKSLWQMSLKTNRKLFEEYTFNMVS